jgi:atypical dual specificity phosphatase
MENLNKISPEYPRIPHLDKNISKMTHDDILFESKIEYPIEGYVQEKVDGSNMGVSWFDGGPVLRNREHILKKGYSKIRTPAKAQFKSAWNWVHDHKKDIEFIKNELMSDVTIYGEWMNYSHSIVYDKLPDKFLAYDIWVVEDNKFVSPEIFEGLLNETKIKFIKSTKVIFNSIGEIIEASEINSQYRNGLVEGIVFKTVKGNFVEDRWKVVNRYFERRNDFNESDPVKNKLGSMV